MVEYFHDLWKDVLGKVQGDELYLGEAWRFFFRRKYGDSIRYTDMAFTVTCLRVEPRRQTHPWNHLLGITVVSDTHIRLDFKNGNRIILAYLTDTDDLIQTARTHISM